MIINIIGKEKERSMRILTQNDQGCLQLLKKKKKKISGNKWRKQASKRVKNDSANITGQICKAAYALFHERAVVFGISESPCASGK